MRTIGPLVVTACVLVAAPVHAASPPPGPARVVEGATRLAKQGELVAARDALADVVYGAPDPAEPA
ncbi:MAG: hypothetical protein ACRELB_14280, partial [Polyangiaceae bacterium]